MFAEYGQLGSGYPLESARILHAVSGFEFFDLLASSDQTPLEVIPIVQRLARTIIGLSDIQILKSV